MRQVTLNDSHIDQFVPYSSPYILCWHNNKERLEDVTMYNASQNSRENASQSDSVMSEVERGRGEEVSSDDLVQLLAGKF